MFNFKDFIKNGLLDAIGKLEDYRVILNAAGWRDKGVLNDDDLAEIESLISVKNGQETELLEHSEQ